MMKKQFEEMAVQTHQPQIDNYSEMLATKLRGDDKVYDRLYSKSKERHSKAMKKEQMIKEKENMEIPSHKPWKSKDLQVHINLYDDAKKRLSKLSRLQEI